jgi:hypothetical protein
MKKYLLLGCLMAIIATQARASNEPTFIEKINILWKAKNYNEILQLATTEAAKQPSPAEAHAVLFGYYLFITANHDQAVQSLNNLLESLNNASPAGFQAVTAFKNDFLQVPAGQMQAPTPAQLDDLHRMFPDDFPIKSLLLSISDPN